MVNDLFFSIIFELLVLFILVVGIGWVNFLSENFIKKSFSMDLLKVVIRKK